MSFVIVWENNKLPGGRSENTHGHKWVGHVSMNIGDKLNPDCYGTLERWTQYVSWIPAVGDGVKEKEAAGLTVQSEGMSNGNFSADVRYERYWPDHVIHVPDGGFNKLDAEAKWKEIYLAPVGKYNMATRNCSDIVAEVMKAGGFSGRGASGAWASNNLVWTPNKVRKFALACGGRYMSYDDFLPVVRAAGLLDCHFLNAYGGAINQTRDGQFCTFRTPNGCAHNNDKSYKAYESELKYKAEELASARPTGIRL